jgi:hypothetical protein
MISRACEQFPYVLLFGLLHTGAGVLERTYRRTWYFVHNELSRLVMDALRLTTAPFTAADIATAVMRAKGTALDEFQAIVAERALCVLPGLAKRGDVVRTDTSRNAQRATARTK